MKMKRQLLNFATQPELDKEACWQVVLDKDEHLDGAFVYGVRSTLIFCRPSCPSPS
jgi:methylphosphotriester-DNA--protein-cysteine methyltransferase